MRPYLLTETNWKAIREHMISLAVLPWGATEAHNYHLPYGTDVIEADHIAAEAGRIAWGKGTRVMIMPTIPFGVNTGQHDILLDMNLNPSTQYAILSDVITVLDRQGINKLLIVNSHGGNDFKTMLRELGLKFPAMLLVTCNWFQSLDKRQYFDKDGDHADEMETSLIMHLRPELVRPLDEAGDGAEKKPVVKALTEKWAWAERKWSQVTDDTGIGDPRQSTAEKGAKYFKDVTVKLADLFIALADADPDRLYK